MNRSSAKRLSALLVSIVACLVFFGSSTVPAVQASRESGEHGEA